MKLTAANFNYHITNVIETFKLEMKYGK